MNENIKISDWVEQQLINGRYTFALSYLQECMPGKSDESLKAALKRLVGKKKIISIYKGFYIIIPPSYSNYGIIPPSMFLDDLMTYLNRPYYISLLSAAAMHGAAHQQPQSYFVCTVLPSMRKTRKNGLEVKYVSKRVFPNSHIKRIKTESGYVSVSDPVLTCLDLINYNKTVGGLNRVVTVIYELSEEINKKQMTSDVLSLAPVTNLQRLGYLWEYECGQKGLSDILFNSLESAPISLKSCKLLPSGNFNEQSLLNRWKVNVNQIIELDE